MLGWAELPLLAAAALAVVSVETVETVAARWIADVGTVDGCILLFALWCTWVAGELGERMGSQERMGHEALESQRKDCWFGRSHFVRSVHCCREIAESLTYRSSLD